MKTLVNRTRRPLQVHLPQGKVLHLGPAKTGRVADEALEHPAVRRRIEAGELAVVGEGGEDAPGAGPEGRQPEATRGFQPPQTGHHRGNR